MSTKMLIFVILNFINMYYVYALAEPVSMDIRYIGITTNLNIRFTNHLSRINEGNPKSNWISELRKQGLKPTLIVLDSAELKKEALKKESLKIIELKEKGYDLLNVVHQKIYYKFDLEGNLIDKILSVRQKHKMVKVNTRLTYGGFVWNDEPVFPKWKLEQREKSKAVNRKEIHQYTKDGIFVNTFEGVREAHRITNIDHRSISACATFRRPSAGGYVWRYEKQ